MIRMLERRDLPVLGQLLRDFMQETFGKPWHGSEAALERDAFGARLNMAVALAGEPAIGFIGWTRTYDLHHCIAGASICDMYVAPERRGRGVALELVCFAAKRIRDDGGLFIQFRAAGDLAGKNARDIARALPKREWNFEP